MFGQMKKRAYDVHVERIRTACGEESNNCLSDV